MRGIQDILDSESPKQTTLNKVLRDFIQYLQTTPGRYCLLLKRMKSTCTAWVESSNTRDDGRGGKKYADLVKNMSLYHRTNFLSLLAICYEIRLIQP